MFLTLIGEPKPYSSICTTADLVAITRRSMADQDSDRWVFEVLAPDIRRRLKNIRDGSEWTDLV